MRRPGACARAAVLLTVAVLASACSSGSLEGGSAPTSTGTVPSSTTGTETTIGTVTTIGSGSTSGVTRVAATSEGCSRAAPVAAGTTDHTMRSGGVERDYQLIVPPAYDGATPMPVVLALHALTVDHRLAPTIVGFAEVSDTHDFIGVSPSGLLDDGVPYWVAAATEPRSRDVTFVADLLDRLEAELCLDPTRVFAVGMSNGAQMSALLACQLGDRVAAVAPIAGVEHAATCGERPVPVMAFHGDADLVVPYEGGGLDAAQIADMHAWKGDPPGNVAPHDGVDSAMANWAARNGCAPRPIEETVTDEVVRIVWRECEAETILYRIVGGGHTWPGRPGGPDFEAIAGHTTVDISATDLVFDFFLGT